MCLFRWKDLHFQLKFPTPSRYGSNAPLLYGQQSNAHWFLGEAGGGSCWNLIDQCIKIQIFSPNGECRAVTFSYYLYVFPFQIPVTSACHLRFLLSKVDLTILFPFIMSVSMSMLLYTNKKEFFVQLPISLNRVQSTVVKQFYSNPPPWKVPCVSNASIQYLQSHKPGFWGYKVIK